MTTELIISEDLTPAIFFDEGDKSVASIVYGIRKRAEVFKADVTTKKGQDSIRSFARKVASSKAAIDAVGKEAVDGWNKQVKEVNGKRKSAKEEMQSIQDMVRKPLTDFENAEKARVEAHSSGINQIRESGEYHQVNWQEISIEDMEAQLVEIKSMATGEWQEFNDAAEKNIKEAVEKIEASIAKKTQYDKDQADLGALRATAAKQEQIERDAKIADEAVEAFKAREVAVAIAEVLETPKVSEIPCDLIISYQDEKHTVQEMMQKFGGSFVQALGVALTRADDNNTRRIKEAFPDYWNEALDFASKR